MYIPLVLLPWFILDGASLFYTSVKENKNCSLLYKYLVHRIYGLPFNSPALVVDKESVFMWVIPKLCIPILFLYSTFNNVHGSTGSLKLNECFYSIAPRIFQSLYVSSKLPTYPSPKPKFCSKWEGCVLLRGGVGGEFAKNVQWSEFSSALNSRPLNGQSNVLVV